MKERFFKLDELPPAVPAEQVVGLVVSGYPIKKQDYGFTEEIRKLGFAVAPIICSIAPDQSKEDTTVLKLMSLSPLKFDLDGMSGGAAFVLQLVNGTAHAHLAGMIVMGANDKFHILKIGPIMNSINSWLNKT